MTNPFVIIGGDAAGLSAASKFKREAPHRDVIVFEKGEWVSYAYCGIPYYVKGEVESLTDLLSLSPEQIDERGIDLRRNHEVIAIDTDAQSVTVWTDNEEFDQPYSDLLIATGARALTAQSQGCHSTVSSRCITWILLLPFGHTLLIRRRYLLPRLMGNMLMRILSGNI